jgi:iron complex outermembrane receptor protein
MLVFGCLHANGQSGKSRPPDVDVAAMTLEQLMDVEVTSVSKKEQPLSKTAAAIFVLTSEDIRRSGATNLPDLLRMVPGVNVAQISSNAWAIAIRGFNERYSNKVLVLIDGRTVYTPAFSGVYWDHLQPVLENIERIEVIRGPGATVWGANAVNGVINIITKPASATQGVLVSVGVGSEQRAVTSLQYGGALGRHGTYRVFGTYSNLDDLTLRSGREASDGWDRARTGFRADWQVSSRDRMSLQGELFSNRESQLTTTAFVVPTLPFAALGHEFRAAGGNVLGRWDHSFTGGSDLTVQMYYDRYRRDDLGAPQSLRTFDIDLQHHVALGRHDIVWGLGYRSTRAGLSPGYALAATPPFRTDGLWNTFIQDEIQLTPRLWLTVGAKLEHNAYSGFELEPGARIAWAFDKRHTLWASAARAIRQPSRLDTGIDAGVSVTPLAANTVQVVRLVGNPDFEPEELRDFEIGHRSQLTETISVDTVGFLSFYRRLRTVEPLQPYLIPGSISQLVIPLTYQNLGNARNYGAEISINWNVTPRWQIQPGYSFLQMNIEQGPASLAAAGESVGNAPKHTFQFRSRVNLSKKWEFDQSAYFVDRLQREDIPSRVRLDSRLAYRLREDVEISLVGQNLLRPRQMEFGDAEILVGTQTERGIFAKVTWRF